MELDPIKQILYEFPVQFPPSYPYEEDVAQPLHYMSTRCPSWCDRVLVSPAAKLLIANAIDDSNAIMDENNDGDNQLPTYSIIGENICMGDHKVLCYLCLL